jgi:hypothetical protein
VLSFFLGFAGGLCAVGVCAFAGLSTLVRHLDAESGR